MEIIAAAVAGLPQAAASQAAESGAGLVFNGFWIIIAAVNFLFFLVVLQQFAFGPVGRMLDQRRARIEQGLRDADAARVEREAAADERVAVLAEARREANEIVSRAQKAAEDLGDREVAAAREEIQRLHQQAEAEIRAERDHALGLVRAEVADLALRAAGRVVGETMNAPRERRLVEEFLAQAGSGPQA